MPIDTADISEAKPQPNPKPKKSDGLSGRMRLPEEYDEILGVKSTFDFSRYCFRS
jgi:hypothetical protein